MAKKVLVSLVAGMLLVSVSMAAFGAPEESNKVTKSVVLPIELKDPITAQTLALYPFYGPPAAAKYVGTTRLSIEVDPKIVARGRRDALINIATFFGGILIAGTSPTLGSFIAIYGPFLENYFLFSRYYVEKAIEFNKKQYERFEWTPPISSHSKKDKIKIALLETEF